MIREALQYLVSLAPPTLFPIDGKMYSSKGLTEVEPEQYLPPTIPQIKVHTLTGLGDLISNDLDAQFKGDVGRNYAIHIDNFNKVSVVALVSDATDYTANRQVVIEATPVEFQPFEFGRWMTQEDFVISARARFCDTPDLTEVLNLASTLTNEAILTSEDNGFTQKATAKAGLKQKENVTIKPVVSLAPFRIFPEVPQPISPFVFRAKVENEVPKLALFEADGGKWKNDAIKAIAQYLKGLGTELPIIA